jgi:hypothetical protein
MIRWTRGRLRLWATSTTNGCACRGRCAIAIHSVALALRIARRRICACPKAETRDAQQRHHARATDGDQNRTKVETLSTAVANSVILTVSEGGSGKIKERPPSCTRVARRTAEGNCQLDERNRASAHVDEMVSARASVEYLRAGRGSENHCDAAWRASMCVGQCRRHSKKITRLGIEPTCSTPSP